MRQLFETFRMLDIDPILVSSSERGAVLEPFLVWTSCAGRGASWEPECERPPRHAGARRRRARAALVAAARRPERREESRAAPPPRLAEIEAETRSRPRWRSSATRCARTSTSCSTETRVDPDSVRVAADFAPFEVVGRAAAASPGRRDSVPRPDDLHPALPVARLCPVRPVREFEFPPARSRSPRPARAPGTSADVVAGAVAVLRLLALRVGTRRATDEHRSRGRPTSSRCPAVSYRRPPALLVACCSSAQRSLALAGLGARLSRLAARAPPAPEPEPEPEPRTMLSPARAGAHAARAVDPGRRRGRPAARARARRRGARARRVGRPGSRADRATLAWSEDVPPVDETTSLAARVRTAAPRAPRSRAELNGDGMCASAGRLLLRAPPRRGQPRREGVPGRRGEPRSCAVVLAGRRVALVVAAAASARELETRSRG